MADAAGASIVLETDRHLKWRAFDRLERALMILCGVCLTGFTLSTLIDVITRESGHPLLSLQEVTSAFFVYGIFVGTAVATRRNDHLFLSAITERMTGRTRIVFEVFNRAVVVAVGISMAVFGWQNFLTGFGSFRMPSMLPIAYLYIAIPVSGALVALFAVEQIANGLRNGFAPVVGEGMLRDTGI
ncbi:MAG TPA: TRAP transporter small permease subunit [Acetobacteraceae bacterium]|jgi:TRAP-type C4-dicarboxylate transport system permease small subunit|nr:TRAP transporter small permease subunit [Acetobacteraceae bacterium]